MFIPLLLALLILSTGCQQTTVGESVAAIGGGMVSDNESVVLMYTYAGSVCSGAVIGPRAVLSVKSCTHAGSDPIAASGIQVFVGSDMSSFDQMADVAEVIQLPGPPDSMEGVNDLVVLILTEDLIVPPLPLATTSPVVDDMLTVVGYGQTETGASGRRQEGELTVTAVQTDLILSEGGSVGICSGDGPALDASGAVAAMGIFVFDSAGGPPTCPSGSGFRDVATYRDFVMDAIAMSSEDAGMPDAGLDDGGVVDAGGPSGGGGGGGCGCSLTSSPAPNWWVLPFALVALALSRRSRSLRAHPRG